MNFLLNLFLLVFNMIKGIVLSSWYIAQLIIKNPGSVRSGTTNFHYGELEPNIVSLLGALISLSPGTTTVIIDLYRRELVLHLLDLDRREETLLMIQRDFVLPLRNLSREKK